MKLMPTDIAAGATFLLAALLIVHRDIADWCREARAWLQVRKVSR